MEQSRELLGPFHENQPVLIRMHDDTWSDIGATILSVYDEGNSVAVICTNGDCSITMRCDRENVKLKF